MRANLQRGKYIQPKNLTAALQRRKQLEFETKRIAAQIEDTTRAARYPDVAEYNAWHESAEQALRLFHTELRLLNEWIDVRQHNAERLLRDAYELLKVLEVETDFDSSETLLMERLDDYFDSKEDKTAVAG